MDTFLLEAQQIPGVSKDIASNMVDEGIQESQGVSGE